MDRWSPYANQNFSQLSSGSPHLPSSVPPEDSLNNYGENNSTPLLMSSCQGLPLPTNADPSSTGGLSNSNYENLIAQTIQSSKETEFYEDSLYNGVCKESQLGEHNFLQAQSSVNRADGYSTESIPGYTGQMPSLPCQPNVFKRGSFGILPHESVVKSHANRYERNNTDKYGAVPPVSYNNGPYTDRDVSNVYSSAPLSAQSAFSGDTASLSPVVNSVTSPSLSNFSSPSDYYSSPKTSYGAYNSVQSPVPLSPSVAQSYPSSPFANVDPSSHISSAPPCSPMSGGIYMNSLNAVPQRNGQPTQHSPSNTAANICYNTPNIAYGPQSVLQKTPPDYHSDYVYDHNSPSSFNSVYPTMHPGQISSGSTSRISPRTHTSHPNSMPHDNRMSYGHSNTMAPAPISSPNYLQNKVSHEAPFRGCSTSINPSQSMHPPRFPPSINSIRNSNMHQNPSSTLSERMGNDRNFNSSDLVDDKSPIELFNYLDASGMHNHDPASSDNQYMDNDPILDGDALTASKQLRSNESNDIRHNGTANMETSNRTMVPCPPILKDPEKETRSVGPSNYPYSSSSLDPVRPGNLSLNASGKRRGRRGRKLKASVNSGNIPRFQSFNNDRNIFNNGCPAQPSNRLEYGDVDCYSSCKRLCDEKELPPVNYSFSRYRSELKMTENQKKNCSVVLSKPKKTRVGIQDECRFLGSLRFPREMVKSIPTVMRTRNKSTEGFLQCYRKFLASRKGEPVSGKKSQSKRASKENVSHSKKTRKEIPKLILKLGESNISCKLRYDSDITPHTPPSDHESASESSGDIPLSSHIKKENDIEEKTKRLKHSGKLNRVSKRYSKHSANRKRTYSDKCYDLKECSHTNSETLPAGEVRVKPEIESAPEHDVELSNSPKKRGRKARNQTSKSDFKRKMRKTSHKESEPLETASFVPVPIKQEIIDEEEAFEGSRRTLRSRRSDTASSLETAPGPSVKTEKVNEKDPIDISSDDDVELLDDSDSDPAWTPSVKNPKADTKGMHPIIPKRRGPKASRRTSGGNAGTSRQKRERPEVTRKKSTARKAAVVPAPLHDPNAKGKKEKERFLVAKVDIDKKTPFIWRVDKETNMLQRFEWYEQQGIILYRSTYTFAAWNEVSFTNYVAAKVRIVSHSRMIYVIEYLGPELTEATEIPALSTDAAAPSTTNPLRENFEVFLQTLISQALDPNFLSEITNENDEYFLNNIKEIENISDDKKKVLVGDFWEEDLLKSANTYPSLGIQDIPTAGECEVCKQDSRTKLLQFHGQSYDWITLGTIELLLPPKVQYNVCAPCSATISLYNRLQHHKYNFFIKCRSKMNDVKGTSDKMESHVLLEECLQDITWVNSLFEELETMWKQCDEKS